MDVYHLPAPSIGVFQEQMPLCQTFWSPCFGMLTDRFGVGWMISIAAA